MEYEYRYRTQEEAVAVCKERYAAACEQFPLTRDYISLDLYLRRNTKHARRYCAPLYVDYDAKLVGGGRR
jgi:hypothetical protein